MRSRIQIQDNRQLTFWVLLMTEPSQKKKPEVKKLAAGYADGYQFSLTATSKSQNSVLTYDQDKAVDGETCRYRSLWRAVVSQMLSDASRKSNKADAKYNQRLAEFWLFHESKDFNMVCDLADYQPSYIRRKANEAKEIGYVKKYRSRAQP